MRIGIDVGGTNTDAVLIDDDTVMSSVKSQTTSDVFSGITSALTSVMQHKSPDAVDSIMLGTTQFANALVEGSRLSPTAVVRLGAPYGRAVPPLSDFPARLAELVAGGMYTLPGGHEVDGREISPFDESSVVRAGQTMKDHGITTAAVSSPFSPVNNVLEKRAADILQSTNPELTVTCSSDIGSIGLLERENAAILNACLLPLAHQIMGDLREALEIIGVNKELYLAQNDGTLMDVDFAQHYPVLTISSGPTNSMRGAAYLSGLGDALVVDVGGTTTDFGALVHGFPRPSGRISTLAGVRTNFRMPDMYSLGLAGGTTVELGSDGAPTIGPASVGARIDQAAMVFGGQQLTMTDVAAVAGLHHVGDVGQVALNKDQAQTVLCVARDRLSGGLDRVKADKQALPAIIVGGGAIVIPDDLEGCSTVIKPEHSDVANAIGAAIAQVGGEVDHIVSMDDRSRSQAVEDVTDKAKQRAIAAGADPETVDLVDFVEVPLTYLPGNTSRFLAKAVGNLNA